VRWGGLFCLVYTLVWGSLQWAVYVLLNGVRVVTVSELGVIGGALLCYCVALPQAASYFFLWKTLGLREVVGVTGVLTPGH